MMIVVSKSISTTFVPTSKHGQLTKGVKLYDVWIMGDISRSFGPIVCLEPFKLPDAYLEEVEGLVRKGPRIYVSGSDDNRASYQFVRAHVALERRDDFPPLPVFDTVREALLPGTNRGGVYLDIPLFPGDELYGHLVVSYRGIPDAVVAWNLHGLFDIDVVVAKPE